MPQPSDMAAADAAREVPALSGPAAMPLRPYAIGCTPRATPAALREHLCVQDAELPTLLALLAAAGLGQTMLLSTCDRVELFGLAASPETVAKAGLAIVARSAGVAPDDLAPHAALAVDGDAVRHIFAVASALESIVLGEPQVLGQLKAAHRAAADAGLVGAELETLLQAAYGVAKRVRSETAVGERPVNLAAAALRVVRDLFGRFDGLSALMLGSGEMGELVAERMIMSGLGPLTILHPVPRRAEALARRLGRSHGRLDVDAPDHPRLLAGADILLCALGSGRPVLSAEAAETVLRRRRRAPQLVLDLAVPPDVDPQVNAVDGAFLYGIGDLERVASHGRAQREEAAAAGWVLVDEGVLAYLRRREARPGIAIGGALRQRWEEERTRLLAELSPRSGIEEATRLLLARLLHQPLRCLADPSLPAEETAALHGAVRRLFLDGRPDGATAGGDAAADSGSQAPFPRAAEGGGQ